MKKRRIGMLGLGIMGSAMAANLIKAGFQVIGYDPKLGCRRRHARAGGRLAADPGQVFEVADIVITSLPSARALLDVSKACSKGKSKTVVIETSTLPIPIKEEARRILGAAGATLLDCPLSGTGAQARTGDLVVFGSGDAAKYRKVVPVLKGFSRSQYHLGPFGNGSKMKFIANLLVAIHNVSSAEALVLARRSGLNAGKALAVLADSAATSRMLQVRGPMMVRRRYLPATMSNRLWQKDMKIIGAFARGLKSPTPLFGATKAVYRETLGNLAESDTAAVAAVLERRAGLMRRRKRF